MHFPALVLKGWDRVFKVCGIPMYEKARKARASEGPKKVL